MAIEKNNTALIIIDMQNDNITQGGASDNSGAVEHALKQNTVNHIKKIKATTKKLGMPIFYTNFTVPEKAYGAGRNSPLLESIANIQSVIKDSWGAAVVAGLEPEETDFIIDRTRMSAFNGTQLDITLRNLKITNVIITGVWTNMAVEHTTRDAADYGYNALFITDATSTINDTWQNAAENFAITNIAEKLTTAELLKKLVLL